LPGVECQPEGATGCRISHPATPPGDWFLPVGSGFLVQRTNLLSPSVTHLPVFKVTLITAASTKFDRVRWNRQQLFFRKSFAQDIRSRRHEIRQRSFFKQFLLMETYFCAPQIAFASHLLSIIYHNVTKMPRKVSRTVAGCFL